MKLKAGKKYITRSGEIVGPLKNDGEKNYPFHARTFGHEAYWNNSGRYGSNLPHELDLIEEYKGTDLQDRARKAAKFKYHRPNKEAGAYYQGWLDGYEACKESQK